MAKKVNQVSLKGNLEINFDKLKLVVEDAGYNLEDLITIEVTEITKDAEYTYDLLEVLNDFNEKSMSITIKEEQELEPIDR